MLSHLKIEMNQEGAIEAELWGVIPSYAGCANQVAEAFRYWRLRRTEMDVEHIFGLEFTAAMKIADKLLEGHTRLKRPMAYHQVSTIPLASSLLTSQLQYTLQLEKTMKYLRPVAAASSGKPDVVVLHNRSPIMVVELKNVCGLSVRIFLFNLPLSRRDRTF